MSAKIVRREVGQSWTAMGDWMWEEHNAHNITNTEVLVYMRLASFDRALASKVGYRDVTVKRMRARMAMSKDTINKAIKSLESKGWLKRKVQFDQFGHARCTRYWLYEPKKIKNQADEDALDTKEE